MSVTALAASNNIFQKLSLRRSLPISGVPAISDYFSVNRLVD